MARAVKKADVPQNISEEYYQISDEILSSFPKYRPPVDFFQFREDILQLFPFSRKGQRLTNEQVEEVQRLCAEGMLFVSRTDHPIYSEHIVKQVDLVLVDANLKESEIADILIRALQIRLEAFFDQPVMPTFEALYRDMMVFTEFVWSDKYRTRLFMRRLQVGEISLVQRSINALCVGVWLFLTNANIKELKRRSLDRLCLGLLLMDAGLTKIPGFILSKNTPLKGEEKEKLLAHPLVGLKMLMKVNLNFDELTRCVLEHHERMDGSGYPQRLKGENISYLGRLAAVADSFAAMLTDRPYAKAKQPKLAAQELEADPRYDSRLTRLLANAYLTGTFDLPAAPPGGDISGSVENAAKASLEELQGSTAA